jgi:COP9 signalosome complex subunit 4
MKTNVYKCCQPSPRASVDLSPKLFSRSAAVTCGVLAPAGPNRSRVLASLCRDERTAQLPNHNILTKMFLDRILRPYEIKEFQSTLKPHQLAKIAQSSHDRAMIIDQSGNGDAAAKKRVAPETVLDRAVMEHNLLSCSRIYNNITFVGLGDLLDLSSAGAETMARRMIEQGRLRGSIDQIAGLLWFEGRADDEVGKAGGLGEVEYSEETGAPATKNWDRQIREISTTVSIQKVLLCHDPDEQI